jgi:hypothetical protein
MTFGVWRSRFDVLRQQKEIVPMSGESQEFVEAVVHRIFANTSPVQAFAVVVLSDAGRGVAIGFHDLCDVRHSVGQSASETTLRIPSHLMLSRVPTSTRRAANRSRRIGVREQHTFRRDPIHVRSADIRRMMLERAEVTVSLVVSDDDQEIRAGRFAECARTEEGTKSAYQQCDCFSF